MNHWKTNPAENGAAPTALTNQVVRGLGSNLLVNQIDVHHQQIGLRRNVHLDFRLHGRARRYSHIARDPVTLDLSLRLTDCLALTLARGDLDAGQQAFPLFRGWTPRTTIDVLTTICDQLPLGQNVRQFPACDEDVETFNRHCLVEVEPAIFRIRLAVRRYFFRHMRLNEVTSTLQPEVRKYHLGRAIILDVEDIEIAGDIRFDHKAHGVSRLEPARRVSPHRAAVRASPEERAPETDGPYGSRSRPSLGLRLMGDHLVPSAHEVTDHLTVISLLRGCH